MTNQFDTLNNLTSADEEDIKEQIEKYFNEMDLDEPEKEKRIGLATDIEKGFRNLFILMLTAQIVGESLESRRDDYVDFVYHDYTDAMIENGYSSDEYYTGQGYVEQYARRRCEEIVDTAILHKADSYYFSTDHSIAIGEDETNAVGNYQREQMAIAQGYTMKTWVTFQDNKVRHSHRLLQGRTINIFKPFEVGNGLMMFPLDVSLGVNMKEVYNCRCICEYSGLKNLNVLESGKSDDVYNISDAYIDSLAIEYARFEDIAQESQDVLRYAKANNNSYEVASLYGQNGELLREPIKGTKTDIDVNCPELGRTYRLVHNHPNNSSFSNRDLLLFVEKDNMKEMVVVKNSGGIEVIRKSENFDKRVFLTEYGRARKKFQKDIASDEQKGYDKLVKAILTKNKAGLLYEV